MRIFSLHDNSKRYAMKTRLICISAFLFFLFCTPGFSQNSGSEYVPNGEKADADNLSSYEGTVLDVVVHSPGLENNLLGDSPYRPVTVYLPPGYGDNPCMYYPVVYLLHGYNCDNHIFLKDGGYNMDIKNILNDLISQDIISPLIIVMPNSKNAYYGSMYTNSIVTGNWEDFIVDDVVNYVDRNFRTLPQRESRGITGHSMGGYGTFKLAMRNPQVFHALYGLSIGMLVFEDLILGKLKENLIKALLSDPDNFETLDYGAQGAYAMAAAFAPNPSTKYFGELPITAEGVVIDSIWQKWLKHDPYTMLPSHKDSLLKYHAIQFDCGEFDENGCFPINVKFSEALDQHGIEHVFEGFEGGHKDKIGERIEQKVLPFFSDNLADSLTIDSFIPNLLYIQYFETDENSPFRGKILLDTCHWDVDSISYAIIEGDTAGVFSIDNETKEILGDSSKLNYETVKSYDLKIQASYKHDSVDITDTIIFYIKLRNLNDNSPVLNDTTFIIQENSPAMEPVGTLGAEDLDGDIIYFEIIDGNTNGTFSISKQLGQIRVANPDSLDYESIPQFNLTVVVRELFGPHTDTATVIINIIDVITSIPSAEDQDFLKIYPNPTGGILYLDVLENSMQISEVEIISITGRTIYHKAESIEQVDVSPFTNGLYFVKVRVNGNMYLEKVIIQE
jgi:S-formylglutathione hydrolase